MIVDASVAIKWLVSEDDSDLAVRLIDLGELTAPDLIASEIANAIWKKWHRKEITAIPENIGAIMSVFESVQPISPLLERAVAMSVELDHPAYDCFYLALAEATGDRVVTADRRFLHRLADTRYAVLLLDLGEVRRWE